MTVRAIFAFDAPLSDLCAVAGPTVIGTAAGLVTVVFAEGQGIPCYRCRAVVPANALGVLAEHVRGNGVPTDEFLSAAAFVRKLANRLPRA